MGYTQDTYTNRMSVILSLSFYCEIGDFVFRIKATLSKILCKWKQDSAVSIFLYLDSVFKYKHKLVHNQSPAMNRLCPFLFNLHK